MYRESREPSHDGHDFAAQLIFEEISTIFRSTEALDMNIEDRFRLCANALILALQDAGFDFDRHFSR